MNLPSCRVLAGLLTCTLLACAHTPPPETAAKDSFPDYTRPQETGPFQAKAFASAYRSGETCVEAAAQLRATSPENGWEGFKACVRVHELKSIRDVLTDTWTEDLRTRPDAYVLLTHLIASRGGALNSDIPLLHRRRIPLFTLAMATADPETYIGKYVLIRAKVEQIRNKGKPALELAEYSLGSVGVEQAVGNRYRSRSSGSGSGRASYSSSRSGNSSASGSGSYSTEYSSGVYRETFDNLSDATGRRALGLLSAPDPFLVADTELLLLARFDGVRMTDKAVGSGEEPERKALLTIITYVPPNPMVVF